MPSHKHGSPEEIHVPNTETLRARTCKDLAQMAKKKGISGWHSMRKEQLVRALLVAARRKASENGRKKAGPQNGDGEESIGNGRNSHSRRGESTRKRIRQLQVKRRVSMDISQSGNGKKEAPKIDRLFVMVRGPHWLHVYWELQRRSVERAAAAMGQRWHAARPVLRLLATTAGDTTNTTDRVLRDVEIHGGANDWYVHVDDPPLTCRLEIGYLAPGGGFHSLARSNTVTTPPPGASDALDENWIDVAENCDKIYAMSGGYSPERTAVEIKELFEERLRRPMGSPLLTRFGMGAEGQVRRTRDFYFEVDAEMIVYGVTTPGSHVTVRGEPVELRQDGSFTMRLSMPDRRQVVPVVSSSADGVEQRTTVLAVERNTKVLESVLREPEEASHE